MEQIIAINPTKKGRYALFGVNGFLFSVDEETLAKSGVEKDSVLSHEELAIIKQSSDTRKAKDAALRYISRRNYGERELYEKLLLRYDEYSCASAVAAMCELELLNDSVFAADKAKAMIERGKTIREIGGKLAAIGVDKQIIEETLHALEVDEVKSAYALVQKCYMDKLKNGEQQKVMAALARRGFTHSDIVRAIDLVREDELGGDE